MVESCDIFVIGGGVNGTGIARDAAGRGLSVILAEAEDLASGTSSQSTKLFHGGLRYLEYFEFRLVRESLREREVLLRAMPHISWPMGFVLPLHPQMRFDTETPASRLFSRVAPWMRGRRPGWMIRLGLFIYDHLGGREILPATRKIDLTQDPAGEPLKPELKRAYQYADCWVQDARLVVLNARDAQKRKAKILTHTRVTSVQAFEKDWQITCEGPTGLTIFRATAVVNASGPWVDKTLDGIVQSPRAQNVRLVRGSHIVTRKLFDHDRCYFFQGKDGRIIFAIPFEQDFTLIGTTDQDHDAAVEAAECSEVEADYLCAFASEYFARPVTRADIVWTYSGVRPLYDDHATSATAATRDYVLRFEDGVPPLLNVFGGKITTYRKLSEQAVDQLCQRLGRAGEPWTKGAPLPGGDFAVRDVGRMVLDLVRDYPFLDAGHALRIFRTYGTEARSWLASAKRWEDLGQSFGGGLTAAEVTWQMVNEFAESAEDVIWRRTKAGLRMTREDVTLLDDWMDAQRALPR